jgi:hypothetical protein
MRDLIGFLYIIFVCAAAYGVVSVSLTMYDDIEFTAQNITSAIFYRTYWYLYGSADNEKSNLDSEQISQRHNLRIEHAFFFK